MSTPEQIPARISRIIERLIDLTGSDELRWERGAPFDSYAVSVATVRFRIRTASGTGEPPYILEFLGEGSNVAPVITGDTMDSAQAELIQRLYNAARSSATRHSPDPFDAVERELGTAATPSVTP
jgi:hypothetical protein